MGDFYWEYITNGNKTVMAAFETLRHTLTHTVIDIADLSKETFSLKFTRGEMNFIAGQHICVGPKDDLNMREYSIYSGTEQNFLEILVKEIKNGYVSKLLRQLKKGMQIKVEGPFGYFVVEEEEKTLPLYGIATGTGIAPFHCFALSHPHLSFTILHGIRHHNEQYDSHVFSPATYTYIPCISKDKNHDHYCGRVSDYLRDTGQGVPVDSNGIYFLCGNCDMIYEVFDILQSRGVPAKNIKAEVYF